jgi:hypothetical protein
MDGWIKNAVPAAGCANVGAWADRGRVARPANFAGGRRRKRWLN